MENQENHKIVPSQYTGRKTGASETVEAVSVEEAAKLFQLARSRMMDVNNWGRHENLGTEFFLYDSLGNKVDRPPQPGDFICIDLPAPGNTAGDGNDWVHVEALEDQREENNQTDFYAFRVRPSENPTKRTDETAHFYRKSATSTFILSRNGKTVTAAEYGRNEQPNTDTEKVQDKIRNTVMAVGASSGLAIPQWKSLMKGFLRI